MFMIIMKLTQPIFSQGAQNDLVVGIILEIIGGVEAMVQTLCLRFGGII